MKEKQENVLNIRFWSGGSVLGKNYPIGTNRATIERDFDEFRKKEIKELLNNLHWDIRIDTITYPSEGGSIQDAGYCYNNSSLEYLNDILL